MFYKQSIIFVGKFLFKQCYRPIPVMDSKDNDNGVDADVTSNNVEPEKSRSRKISLKKKISLPNRGLDQINENDNEDILMKFERSKSLDPTQNALDDFCAQRFRARALSIMSLGDMGGQ